MRLLGLIALVFLLSYGSLHHFVHASDAPFLYYPGEGGVVIERADGTDRRVITLNIPQGRTLTTLQWSPSGRWLLWQSMEMDFSEFVWEGSEETWLTSYDGRDSFSLNQRWGYVATWTWAPSGKDWLLLSNVGYANNTVKRWLVDVNTRDSFEDPNLSQFPQWSAESRYSWHFRDPLPVSNGPAQATVRTLVTVAPDGTETERPIYGSPYETPSNGLLYLHPERKTLIVEDLASGTWQEYDTPLTDIYQVIWSPNEHDALILTDNGSADYPDYPDDVYRLWVLTEDGLKGGYLSVYPPQTGGQRWTIWTPDGRHALLETREEEAVWVSMDNGEPWRTFLPYRSRDDDQDQNRIWAIPLHQMGVQWFPDGKSGFIYWLDQVWRFNLETGLPSHYPTDFDGSLDISASGRYLAALGTCERPPQAYYDIVNYDRIEHFNCLWARDAWSGLNVPAKAEFGFSYVWGYADWHSKKDWVLFVEEFEMRYPDAAYSVAHGSGRDWRYLFTSNPWYRWVAWLPDNVPYAAQTD